MRWRAPPGWRKSLTRYYEDIGLIPPAPRELAERRLPEVERLIARATQMRAWLETATRCDA